MCRYAFYLYKPHYVCFNCRKMFKRRLLHDIREGDKEGTVAKCPQCGGLTADMGLDFKPPRSNNIKAWEHIHNLFKVGITFHSCGCSGPGYIPSTKEKLLEELERRKLSYIENMRLWLNYEFPATRDELKKDLYKMPLPHSLYQQFKKKNLQTHEAVDYWKSKIDEIDNYIQIISTGK